MFTIHMTFEDQEKTDLDRLNEVLQGLHLSQLRLEDSDGYLCVTTGPDGNLLDRRYGLREIKLECENATDEEDYVYQIHTEVLPGGKMGAGDGYFRYWNRNHPGRVMRLHQMIAFDGYDAHLVLHHPKVK